MPRENTQGREHDDDLVMQLVDQALTRPPGERESYLREACSDDPELFREAWTYVEWEERMQGFLLEPLFQAPAAEHPFQENDLIEGRFRIEREIDQGGMGIVYQVWDEKLDRRIAIKWPKTGFGTRLPPEVRLAREIRHFNVCEIHEIHTARTAAGDIDFIVMEYLEGETLADRLARRSLPQAEARSIARQLSAGLSAAHAQGVIHGDLKSQNVILTRQADGSMRAVITDFGLARERESPQATAQSGPRGGTPDYMAPELWNGERATPASDVYALGVVLQELANGRRPESGAIAPAKRKPIVSKCLASKPGDRPSAAKVAKKFEPWEWGRWLRIAAAAVPIAALAIYVTYKVATRPHEVVRLAMAPLIYDADLAPAADGVFRGTLANLARLKGGTRARYSVVPPAGAPTHVLNGALIIQRDHLLLHAMLTDTRTGANVKDWNMEYTPGQLRYASSALAGIVTGALHLPPLATPAMKAAVQADYRAASDLLRHDLTVDAAIAAFERVLAADSDSALAFAGLADAQYEKYTITHEAPWLARATDNEREALRRNPDLPRVLFVSASLATGNSAYDQAIAAYLRALELDPQYADAWTRLGRVYELNGQPDEALPAHIRATRVDPDYYRAYVELGQFLIRKYQYSEALTPLRKAVELAPAEPYARYSLALDYLNLGQFRDAESHLRIALDVQPTIFALETLGVVLAYQRRQREAIPLLRQAVALDSGQYYAWAHLGDCYRHLRLPHASELAYRRGLEAAEIAEQRNPKRGYARSFAAYFNARLGNRQLAESEIRQALTLSPDGNDVIEMAVATYEALGERETTLSILASVPATLLADLSRWPDLAGLHSDPRFTELLLSKQVQ